MDSQGKPVFHDLLRRDTSGLKGSGSDQSQRHVYSDLKDNEIRILQLEPGSFGSPLRATLQHANIDTAVYEAISYTWGEETLPEKLEIIEAGALRITSSLHLALQHFRHKTKVRSIWADAVCINQQDNSERSYQVSIMSKIYNKAAHVLVWLGASQDSDVLAFATMAALDQVPGSVSQPLPKTWKSLLASLDDSLPTMSQCTCCGSSLTHRDDISVLGLLSIGRLLQRPWFERLWVVQEVLAAEQGHVLICCGFHCAQWTQFRSASMLLGAMYESASPRLRSVKGAEMAVMQHGGSIAEYLETFDDRPKSFDATTALEMIVAVWNRSCSDPKDRVLALYNLLHMDHLEDLHVNYDLAPGEIYRRLALSFLDIRNKTISDHDQPWALLNLVGTESTAKDDYDNTRPSWVPDLHHLSKSSVEKLGWLHSRHNYDYYQFRPCASLFNIQTIPNNPATIKIRGRCFAQIIDILPDSAWPERATAADENFGKLDIPGILAWYSRCREFTREVFAKTNPNDVDLGLTALLTTNYEPEDTHVEYSPEISQLQQSLLDLWEGDCPSFTKSMQHFLPFLAEQPVLSKDKIDRDSFLCRVRGSGREDVGWVSKTAKVGDHQCIFAGAPYPYVVREVEDGCFELLGDAYTANFTLTQALGGGGDGEMREHYSLNLDWFRDWNSPRREMRELVEELGWLELR